MTKEETLRVLAILKAAYPSAYSGMTKREANGVVGIWAMQFADMPVDIVLMAVYKLISTSKFVPSISEVKAKLEGIHWEASDYLRLNDFWRDAPEEERAKYQRIYEATKGYRIHKASEPALAAMLCRSQLLQLDGPADE